ncbi:carbohydrate ABC transporter permease [Microbacterium aoyamense]|uniref:Carbohydrate ABC transporter permease n=1 Tax=Microbacterium aoyamense TaxID=344166 RepID=A0ABN2PLX4_9MICO|nr:carbohydrate ABC transporter permease [Microbacterium aoyamense]
MSELLAPPRRVNRTRQLRSLRNGVGTWILVALFLIFALGPLYWMLVQALQPPGFRYTYPPELFPSQPTLQSFVTVWETRPILLWLRNTLVMALCSAALTIVFAAWGAYAMSRWTRRGVGIAAYFTLATQMMPAIVLMIPIFTAFVNVGLVGDLRGLVIANFIFSLPVATWMLKSIFDTVPESLDEAARVDGCTRLGVLFRIVLPVAAPGVIATTVFAFISAWNEYLFARLIINASGDWVASMGIASFFGEFSTPWPEVMAASIILALPPVVLFLAFQRYFVAGLGGATK